MDLTHLTDRVIHAFDAHLGVLLDALPAILDRFPDAVVVFVEHPHPELTPLSAGVPGPGERQRASGCSASSSSSPSGSG